MTDQLFTSILVLLIVLVIPLVIAIAYFSSDRHYRGDNWIKRKFKYHKYNRWYEDCDTCSDCEGCYNGYDYGYFDDGYYDQYSTDYEKRRRRRHKHRHRHRQTDDDGDDNNDDNDDGFRIIGNDTDKHGCNKSAGYKWCQKSGKCYRPWEEKC